MGNEVTVVDIRCPVGPKALLMKLRQSGEAPKYSPDNLLEISCRDCTRNARQFDGGVKRVVHRFDLSGQLIESAVDH